MDSHPVTFEPIETGVVYSGAPTIDSLGYLHGVLTLTWGTNLHGVSARIRFASADGFRCLDEGDMVDWWGPSLPGRHLLFRVNSGGWLDQESLRFGFLGREKYYEEYLVVSTGLCVNVFSRRPPTVMSNGTR
jgi:hypothetical protein